MAIASVNPATGETLATFDALDERAVDHKLAKADAAYRQWRLTPMDERQALLSRLANHLDANVEEFARTATLEMGKTIASARAEVQKCAFACRHYAEYAPSYLADEVIATNASKSYATHLPIGPVLAVMPWNFPYWQVFRFAAPAVAAGNVALLKHASNVPQCALAIEAMFQAAGAPDGLFQTLLIGGSKVEPVIRDDRVKAVTLTGSEPAGASVGATAGEEIKKVVLELGGSDPFVVMPSADLDKAATTAVTARMLNNGQSCIAAKRFIVHADVYDAFAERFTSKLTDQTMGDPLDESVTLGPLATADIRDELTDQVQRSIDGGSTVLARGGPEDGPGNFYAPTVLAEIAAGSPARQEELFGPVAMLFRVVDIGEAITVANETRFGLGAAAFTNEPAEQARFIRDLEAGGVFINQLVASDPRLPFGGVKKSGVGRELSREGIREFVNTKTVSVA